MSTMTDQDEDLEEEAPPLVGVEDYDDEAAATEAARELVLHGIGATVQRMIAEEPVAADGDPTVEGAEAAPARPVRAAGEIFYRLLVLDHEERRALELLGVVDPAPRPEANPVERMKPVKAPFPWKKVLPIYFAALILVPLAAFYFTYWITSR